MTNQLPQRLARATRIAGALLTVACAGACAIATPTLVRDPSGARIIIYGALPLALALFGLYAVRRPNAAALSGLVTLGAIIVGLYGIELGTLVFFPHRYARPYRVLAQPGVRDADTRAPLVVATEMQEHGVDAVPRLYRPYFRQVAGASGIRPLSGVSGVLTVMCAEDGRYRTYKSDRFGFSNPDSVWNSAADVVILGDSFMLGECVDPSMTVAAQLRTRGVHATSLGVSGNGPLSELATLIEFGSLARPKTVVWVYYEGNDLADLANELSDSVLVSYLASGTPRSVAMRQPQVDSLLRAAIAADQREYRAYLSAPFARARFTLLLKSTRSKLMLPELKRIGDPSTGCVVDSTFERVLVAGRDAARRLGAEFRFAYLPTDARDADKCSREASVTRPQVLALVKRLGIQVTDLEELRTAEFWRFRGSHMNERGYGRVADALR
ncbi:MAG: hypothetical protein V4550_10260 [Gemmatimonadota bacterium]